MTVKCVSEQDKSEIAQLYLSRLCDSEELAKAYGVSTRTINRVMVERGVNRVRIHKPRPVPAILVPQAAEPAPAPVAPAAPVDLPITMIEPEPFHKRLWSFVTRALRFPFL